MSKWANDMLMDLPLNYVKNNATRLYICSQAPANFTEASETYKLAGKTGMTAASFTGPGDGDISGRKLTTNEQTGMTITANGNATHAALCTEDTLLYVTEIDQQAVVTGNTCSQSAFDVEWADPE